MARRKGKIGKSGSQEQRFEVLLEEVRGQFQAVVEGHEIVVDKLNKMEIRLDRMDAKLSNKIDIVMEKVADHEKRIVVLEKR